MSTREAFGSKGQDLPNFGRVFNRLKIYIFGKVIQQDYIDFKDILSRV